MKRTIIISLVLLLAVVVLYGRSDHTVAPSRQETSQAARQLQDAYNNRASNIQVRGSGQVQKLLRDDTHGSRHQRFILGLESGQTVLVAHNIDLAPRIEHLEKGDRVTFHGEYEWNDKGGVIHWTHHDPRGKHAGGWLKHEGKVYQ